MVDSLQSSIEHGNDFAESDQYDVIVAGGGASGMIAAVTAARMGARVLVIERGACLGGNGTACMVAQWLGFYNGESQAVGGIPFELAERLVEAKGSQGFINYILAESTANPVQSVSFPFNPEILKIVADELVLESGADVLFHSLIVGATVEKGTVTGVILETISGRKLIRGKCIIDATGDAIVAHHAKAPLRGDELGKSRMPMSLVFRLSNVETSRFLSLTKSEKREIALRGVAEGELVWDLLAVYSMPGSHDAICLMSRITELDALNDQELSKAEIVGRQQVKRIVQYIKRELPGFENCELAAIGSRVGVRETRRLEGVYTLSENDVLQGRHFDDSIALGCGPLDVHDAKKGDRLVMPDAPFEIPLRCLLTSELKGLIVTGRAISATRSANGAARHMGTAMALGQAAGTLGALAVSNDTPLLDVPAKEVQDALLKAGAIIEMR